VGRSGERVAVVRGARQRRLHKAFLRYHDPANWPLLRQALQAMGRADLIGNGKQHLVPRYQPLPGQGYASARRKNSNGAARVAPSTVPTSPSPGKVLTQHTGLPPQPGRGKRRYKGKPT
jgi:hypothetical protein